jgi:hypothetical protein
LQSSEACSHFQQENRDSEASKAGTLQHAAAETGDLSILEGPEQVDAVTRYLGVVEKWRQHLAGLGAVKIDDVREVYLSVGEDLVVDKDGRVWKGVTGGFPDNILVGTFEDGSQLGVIIDAKFGKHLVTPTADNMQGISYSRAAMEKWPAIREVACQFFHPYVEVEAELPQYTHTFSRDDYDRLELLIRASVAKKRKAKLDGLNNSSIPATPKTDLCLWCENKAECKALGALMVLGASKHKEISVPDVFNPTELTKPEDYAAAYRFANQFELVAKAVKRRVTDAAMKDGIDVPGFRLQRRRDPEITNVSALKKLAVETFGVTPEEFDNCASVPITKIDAAIKAKAPKGKGAPTVKAFRDAAQEAGALVMGEGYLYLREVSKEEKPAIEESDLVI